jgi:hypothetical protein
MIMDSWSPEIEKRPTTKELLERLTLASEAFKSNQIDWNSVIRNK